MESTRNVPNKKMKIMNKVILIITTVFTLFAFKAQNNDVNLSNAKSKIYGDWQVKQVFEKAITKYTQSQIDQIKNSKLRITSNSIFFENINYIDPCSFVDSNVKISHLFDVNNSEYFWYEKGSVLLVPPKIAGPLIFEYTKEEFSNMFLIELGCGYELSVLYLDGDNLIINYLNGLSLILEKV